MRPTPIENARSRHKKMKHPLRYLLPALVAVLMPFASCSTKKNTSGTRFWHSFTARYNTFFNGNEAYKEGRKAKLEAHKDDYTLMLPFFPESDEKSSATGKTQFETAVTKCEKAIRQHSIKRRPQVSAGERKSPKMKLYLQRKEFNPFLKNAWLLMGRAQFAKGDFMEAASTFSYITRHYAAEPAVASEARCWLARCYAQVNWFYDAEDALSKMIADSTSTRVRRETDATRADLYLRQGQLEKALPFLENSAKNEKSERQKARLYYLLAQVYRELNRPDDAYKAWQRCIRTAPPYEMEFNARIAQTEVMAAQPAQRKKMISKLRRMARNDNNKDFLDQVYFAMGNIHIANADTAAAISAYEKGRAKATRAGVEKGILLLRLGELYWDLRRFEPAQKCYTEALGMLDKERKGYEEATRRSKVLDKLVPHTSAIFLQDSLQALARMSEADRLAAIDKTIELLKQREKAEAEARADSAAQARLDEQGGTDNANRPNRPANTPQNNQEAKAFYFYNQQLVMQGKQNFKQHWGNRKNEDNWRRSNRTVVTLEADEGVDYEREDSLAAVQDSLDALPAAPDSLATDSLADDPHSRDYYLKQIPLTPEAMEASNALLREALIEAGIIEKDDLEDFALAAETLHRLTREHPKYERTAEAYYHLFLIYSRLGRRAEADAQRAKLAADFPGHELTRLITAPDYEHLARHGRHLEDSLYTATYAAYRARRNDEVARNFAVSTAKFPNGLNRPKFMLVNALARLGTATSEELIAELRALVKEFPESDVSTMAGMIVKGLESGRQIGTGTFDLGSLWSRRTAAAEAGTAAADSARALSPDRACPFVFVAAYPSDSVSNNKLLYEAAHFNFSEFSMRGFDMAFNESEGITRFEVSGFSSFDEVHLYAQKIMSKPALRALLKPARVLLISRDNLEKLGATFSYDDYARFYEQHFAPMKLNPELPLDDVLPDQIYEDELTPEQLEQLKKKDDLPETSDDEGEWY